MIRIGCISFEEFYSNIELRNKDSSDDDYFGNSYKMPITIF